MRSDKDRLRAKFEELLASDAPQTRGYSFQGLLSELFSQSGIEVYPKARPAKPRQTDVVAQWNGHLLLTEAKWQQKDISSADIASLRSRLDKLPGDAIGCMFSISDYSNPAIQDVAGDRKREILLFNAREIHSLFSSRSSLSALIEDKRKQLRTNAAVWFEPVRRNWSEDWSIASSCVFIGKAGNTKPWATKSTRRDDVVFSHELPYVENLSGGDCVSFRTSLPVATLPELRHALALAHRHFGLSGKGGYAIHQTPYAWHGFGVEAFLKAVASWQARYAEMKMDAYHHSEELSYFNQLEIGMFCLNGRQQVLRDPFMYSVDMEIRLPGVPVNPGPFQSFCKDLDLEGGHFEPLPHSDTDTVYIHKRRPLKLSQLVISVDKGGESISGAIVENPYYMKAHPATESKNSAIQFLPQSELIFCYMQDWLPVGCEPGTLVLKRIEATWAGHSPVLRPVCTWETSTDHRPAETAAQHTKKFERLIVDTEESEKSLRSTSRKKR